MRKFSLFAVIAILALGLTVANTMPTFNLTSTLPRVVYKTVSAAQDNYEMITPVTGQHIIIDWWLIAASTGTGIYWNDDKGVASDAWGHRYVPDNGTYFEDVPYKLAAAAGLYSNALGACYLAVGYHHEPI